MVFDPLPTRKPCGMSELKKNVYGFSQSRQVSGDVVPEIRYLSLFIVLTSLYLLIVGAEGYCCV
jgi:hypothetical protein